MPMEKYAGREYLPLNRSRLTTQNISNWYLTLELLTETIKLRGDDAFDESAVSRRFDKKGEKEKKVDNCRTYERIYFLLIECMKVIALNTNEKTNETEFKHQ